jgi:hypothetical protein
MQTQSPSSHLETLIPLAVDWATEQQSLILAEGVPLSLREFSDALKVGVKDPEQVRLLQVETIPSPTHPILKAAYQMGSLAPAVPRGLTLHYGIFVRADQWRERSLILHELVHTAQYERLGGIEPFLRQYLTECVTIGYNKSAMESEAVYKAARVLENGALVRV